MQDIWNIPDDKKNEFDWQPINQAVSNILSAGVANTDASSVDIAFRNYILNSTTVEACAIAIKSPHSPNKLSISMQDELRYKPLKFDEKHDRYNIIIDSLNSRANQNRDKDNLTLIIDTRSYEPISFITKLTETITNGLLPDNFSLYLTEYAFTENANNYDVAFEKAILKMLRQLENKDSPKNFNFSIRNEDLPDFQRYIENEYDFSVDYARDFPYGFNLDLTYMETDQLERFNNKNQAKDKKLDNNAMEVYQKLKAAANNPLSNSSFTNLGGQNSILQLIANYAEEGNPNSAKVDQEMKYEENVFQKVKDLERRLEFVSRNFQRLTQIIIKENLSHYFKSPDKNIRDTSTNNNNTNTSLNSINTNPEIKLNPKQPSFFNSNSSVTNTSNNNDVNMELDTNNSNKRKNPEENIASNSNTNQSSNQLNNTANKKPKI